MNQNNPTVYRGRLQGMVAIVTGGAAGIGEAISHKFAFEGANVVVAGLPGDPVDDVVAKIEEHGGHAVGHSGDVSEEADAQAVVKLAVDTFGKLDVLVNNAGTLIATGETQDFPIGDFDYQIKNNLRSAFLMTKYALPELQKTQGNIVNAGSEAGFNGLANNTPYGGTKGFMHAFTMGVAVEQAPHGVRANCVCPGPIDTSFTHKSTGPMTKEMESMVVKATPLGRRGTPEEMANVYAFLASDEASYVTGALWLADGGTTPAKGNVGDKVPSKLAKEPAGLLADRLAHGTDGNVNKEPHTVA